MLFLCCSTSFSEMMMWYFLYHFFFFLRKINFSNFNTQKKKKAEQTIILTISQIREEEARAELLGWIVSLNRYYMESQCISQLFTGLPQQHVCWSSRRSSLPTGRAVRKATGPPLYSYGFPSTIIAFLPSTLAVTDLLVTLHCCFSSSKGSKSNLVRELLCSTLPVCAWFKSLPGAVCPSGKFCLFFSPRKKQTKIPTPSHSPFPKI